MSVEAIIAALASLAALVGAVVFHRREVRRAEERGFQVAFERESEAKGKAVRAIAEADEKSGQASSAAARAPSGSIDVDALIKRGKGRPS